MDSDKKQQIKEIVLALVSKIGLSARVEEVEGADEVRFVVRVPDAGFLIGGSGANLMALNHLVKKIASRQVFGDKAELGALSFSVDINDYQEQKNNSIREMAKMQAQRVRYFKKEILMSPMNAHDRRVVHSVLTEYPDIATESTGDEPNRRVVIKPYNI
jgi:spoIIIJ-associated protein